MDFVEYWTETRTRLDEELTRKIPNLFPALSPQQAEAVQDIIKNGKRLRGCLVCLVTQALGGQIADALPRAMAIECIQAASLIHDDYVDNDTIRRRRPATWMVEGPRRAVLLGDVMLATAIESMMELSNKDGLTATRAIATVANGAYQELACPAKPEDESRSNQHEEQVYEHIIHLKTGALFGAACQLGAIAAGASDETCNLAHAFGARTGEAYQIADDLADFTNLWGDAQQCIKKLPDLFPALNYFCYKAGLAAPYHLIHQQHELYNWCQHIKTDFIGHMEREINLRAHLAASHAEPFRHRAYGTILEEAPAAIVSMVS